MDEFVVPDWISAAVGWRSWRVEMLALQSVSMGNGDRVWPKRTPMKASCYEKRPFLWTHMRDEDSRVCHLLALPEEQSEAAPDVYREKYEEMRPSSSLKGWCYRLMPHAPAPCENHACGIYAVSAPEHAANYVSYQRVVGTVSLWGKVVPGEKGWRAEQAYPKELWVPCAPEDLESRTLIAELLAREYGVPVHVGLPEEVAGHEAYAKKTDSLVAE